MVMLDVAFSRRMCCSRVCSVRTIAAPACRVRRLADDPAGHAAGVLGACGDEAIVRATEGLEVARTLSLADRHLAPVVAGRLEHAERDGVDVRDRERSSVGDGGCEVGCRLQTTEEVRLLEDGARRIAGGHAELVGVGRPAPVLDLDHLEPESWRVRLHDLAHLRVDGLGDDDLVSPGRVFGDEAGVGGDRGAVVAGRVRDVHARQLADRGLILEDRLEDALAHLRLVGRVGGQELAALEHCVDRRRDVVVVDPRTEKRDLRTGVRRFGTRVLQVGDSSGSERAGSRARRLEADACGDVGEESLDRRDADRREHLLTVGIVSDR